MKIKSKHLIFFLTTSVIVTLMALWISSEKSFSLERHTLQTYLLFISLVLILTSVIYHFLDKLNKPVTLKLGLLYILILGLGIYLFYDIYEHIFITMYLKSQIPDVEFGFEKVAKLKDIVGLVFLLSGLSILIFNALIIFRKKQANLL